MSADQPVGELLDWRPTVPPPAREHRGRHVILRPQDPARDAEPLYALTHPPTGEESVWTYLYEGPFESLAAYRRDLEAKAGLRDALFFTITDRGSGRQLGALAYLAIVPEHGTIEIGNIWFGPELQRTPAATEAIFLVATHAFDELGYRRLEWKCDALNAPSRGAALRFGFVFEGVFEQHRVVRGRNRDSAWFAITDGRWPVLRAAFETWLAPENFTADGRQRSSLRELTREMPAA